jgi:predicted aspartyl protease
VKKPLNPPIKLPEGIISLYVQIAGPKAKRTIKMALDTGATFTMIPPEKIIATGHKIPTVQEKMIKIFTASGTEYVPVVTISSLTCLGVTVRDIEVVCHDLPPESPVEGLLGLNFLIHLPAFIDFFQRIQSSL